MGAPAAAAADTPTTHTRTQHTPHLCPHKHHTSTLLHSRHYVYDEGIPLFLAGSIALGVLSASSDFCSVFLHDTPLHARAIAFCYVTPLVVARLAVHIALLVEFGRGAYVFIFVSLFLRFAVTLKRYGAPILDGMVADGCMACVGTVEL